jgi:hypothetical protein
MMSISSPEQNSINSLFFFLSSSSAILTIADACLLLLLLLLLLLSVVATFLYSSQSWLLVLGLGSFALGLPGWPGGGLGRAWQILSNRIFNRNPKRLC